MLTGLSLNNKAVFFRKLATLIESGIPYLNALESMERSSDRVIKKITRAIMPEISAGKALSGALDKFPDTFEPYIIHMVRAGEESGTLEKRLNEIADYLENIKKQQTQLIIRLIYPVFLIHAAVFLAPAPLLFTCGPMAYLQKSVVPLFFAYLTIAALHLLFKLLNSSPATGKLLDSILFHIPLLNWFFKTRAAYRFTRILAAMYEAGIDRETAILAAADASGSWTMKKTFSSITDTLREGATLEQALESTNLIPPASLDLIRTGEESGTLPRMIGKASEELENSYKTALNILTIAVPVLLFLGVAVMIGSTVITTFLNIYKPLESIHP